MTSDFIQRIAGTAYSPDILTSVTIAQAALESGWGTSELAMHANALFGIKADKRWNGRTYAIKTKEWYNDNKPVIIVDKFRAYPTWKASIADHTASLTASPRYRYVILVSRTIIRLVRRYRHQDTQPPPIIQTN